MAKKSSKKDKATAGAAEAVEAVRAAVERTFTASAEGAKSTRGRAKDVTAAANRIREVLEDRVVEELKGLRSDIEGLAKRVSALEVGPLGGASAARGTATGTSTAKKPAARHSTAPGTRKIAAGASSSTARKSASSRAASSRSTSGSSASRSSSGSSRST